MLVRSSLVALALQCFATTAAAGNIQDRQAESASRSKITRTMTITRTATKTPASVSTSASIADTSVEVDPTAITTTIGGETLTFYTTIQGSCSLSECTASTTFASAQTDSLVSGASTSVVVDPTPITTTIGGETLTFFTTIQGSCTLSQCTDSTTLASAETGSTVVVSSSAGSTASSALGETTSGTFSDATASGVESTASGTVSRSVILTTGSGASTISTATGIFSNATTSIADPTVLTSTEVDTSVVDSTSVVSTGVSDTITVGQTSTLISNTTVSATGSILPSSTEIVSTDEPDEPDVITRTVTRDGEITTQTATVTHTVGSPIIIIIQKITLFIFTSALGSDCPQVKPGNNGDFVVDGETVPNLGDACSKACYKQFSKCASNAGKNFKVTDCQTQLGACIKAASTQTVTKAPVTITQTVVLPPDCSTASDLVSDGGSVISTKTLTGGEIATIGTGGVSVVTASFTNVFSETSGASSADASTIPETISQIETTKGVTITKVDESGSARISVITMTLTIPAEPETTAESSALPSGATSVEETEVVETTVASTSIISLTLPPVDGTGTGHISVITITLTPSVTTGTGVSSTALETIETSTGVQTGGSGIPGTRTAQTSVVTMTISPSGTETAIVSTLTMTIPPASTSTDDLLGTQTPIVSTNIVTITIGDTTGIVTMTYTAPPVYETITKTGKCSGRTTVTAIASSGSVSIATVTKTKTVTNEAVCPTTCVQETALPTETPIDPETVYVTETVDAAAAGAAFVRRVRRGFGSW